MSDFWFPWYPALYRVKTLHLTPEQDGVYRRLIDHYMETALPLPENINSLCRIAGCDSDAIGIPLAFFKHEIGIGYRHNTCDSVLADMYERQQRRHGAARTAASARWKKSHIKQIEKCETHANSNANAMPFDATLTLTPIKKERGSRFTLPSLPDDWGEFCRITRPDIDPLKLFDDFRDYWVSIPGSRGVKLDWLATWRTWVRKQYSGKEQNKQMKGEVV